MTLQRKLTESVALTAALLLTSVAPLAHSKDPPPDVRCELWVESLAPRVTAYELVIKVTNQGREIYEIEFRNNRIPFFVNLHDKHGKGLRMTDEAELLVNTQRTELDFAVLSFRGIAPGDCFIIRLPLVKLYPEPGLERAAQLTVHWVPKGSKLEDAVAESKITLPDKAMVLDASPITIGTNTMLGVARFRWEWLAYAGLFLSGFLTGTLWRHFCRKESVGDSWQEGGNGGHCAKMKKGSGEGQAT